MAMLQILEWDLKCAFMIKDCLQEQFSGDKLIDLWCLGKGERHLPLGEYIFPLTHCMLELHQKFDIMHGRIQSSILHPCNESRNCKSAFPCNTSLHASVIQTEDTHQFIKNFPERQQPSQNDHLTAKRLSQNECKSCILFPVYSIKIYGKEMKKPSLKTYLILSAFLFLGEMWTQSLISYPTT